MNRRHGVARHLLTCVGWPAVDVAATDVLLLAARQV